MCRAPEPGGRGFGHGASRYFGNSLPAAAPIVTFLPPAFARCWQIRGMSFDVAITQQRDHTRIVITGNPSIDELLSLVHLLGVESGGWDSEMALVNLRGVRALYSEEEQRRLGHETACSLAHMRKIASVVPSDRITRISEKAARRNGTNVQVFSDEKEALRWLRASEEEDTIPPRPARKPPVWKRLLRDR
jgi:hypothetical protein